MRSRLRRDTQFKTGLSFIGEGGVFKVFFQYLVNQSNFIHTISYIVEIFKILNRATWFLWNHNSFSSWLKQPLFSLAVSNLKTKMDYRFTANKTNLCCDNSWRVCRWILDYLCPSPFEIRSLGQIRVEIYNYCSGLQWLVKDLRADQY